MLYQILDNATEVTWKELRNVYSKLDELEQMMFKKSINPQKLLQIKKNLSRYDYSIGHLASVVKQLQNLCNSYDDLNWKLRDLNDHCERIFQSISIYRSQASTTIDLYWGLQSNKTNRQIKRLTLLASIAVPLTLWSSFWGMNFQFIPYDRPEMFFVALTLMFLTAGTTYWMLVKKGYWTD